MKPSRAFILGLIAALMIVAIVSIMASRLAAQDSSIQAAPELVPQTYLPVVTCHTGCATPIPHQVKAALSQCCTVTCDKAWSYGAEWVSGWSPHVERCGEPFSPMIRDLPQWDAVQAGTYDLSGATMPIQMFNEPENQDCAAGACISLETLITATHEIIDAYPDRELTSPAFLPTWTQPAYGLLDWVDGYYAEYGVYPRFEVLAMHMYGSTSLGEDWSISFDATAADFDTMLSQLATRGYTDLRVWITEMGFWQWPGPWCETWGICPAQENAKAFLQAWLDKCDSDSRCEYVNWFGISNDGYEFVVPLEYDGQLTRPGQAWQGQFN